MDLSERTIPPLRADIVLQETGDDRLPAAAVDRTLGQRVKLDRAGAMIASVLDRPWPAGELLAALHHHGLRVSPELLVRFIRFLDGHLLLASERALRRVAAVVEADQQAASVDLAADSITFLPGTAHNCVACGASCGGHDVGPIAQHQVSAIKDAVPTARFVERHTQSEDTTGHYCAMEGDQCVFLRGDRLCSIHATLGLDPKPTDCRVFPLAFTRTPQGVVAGVRLECRSYLESKDNGGALAERGAELAHLAGAVDSMEEVAPLVRLDASTTLPWADYALLEQSLINAIAGPVVWRGLLAFNDRARALISVAQEADRAGQVFPADAVTSESPDPGPLWDDLVSGCQEAARLNRAAGKTARADRFERVSRGLQALRAGPIHCPPLGPRDDEILADHLRQSLFLKDAITGSSLRFGLGLLNLTVLLAVALVSLDGMSLNHALADVLKALRANPVSGPLHRADEAVAAWLHDDLEGRVAH